MIQDKSTTGEIKSGYDLRPSLEMKGSNGAVVHEFTGMWPLKPDADIQQMLDVLSKEKPYWQGPAKSFATGTTALGLIRTARWFIVNTKEFGPTLFFISQFDSMLEKYFDDFVLNGKENLEKIWGHCVGCPTGPNATARDIVEYIARGQLKTFACYDALPSLNLGQIQKMADWYEKTQKFQRAVASGDGKLEDKVDAYIAELAKPYPFIASSAVIDTEAVKRVQYTDVPERLGVKRVA